MRRADLRMGLVLIALATAMLIGATDIPMTDSYGGVRNVWYVSPALFPLIIAALIFVLALILIANALTTIGWTEAGAAFKTGPLRLTDRTLRFLYIVAVIASYVYISIPRIDFFIATVAVLLPFIGTFWLGGNRPIAVSFAMLLLASAMLVLTASTVGPGPWLDCLAAIVGLVQFYALWRIAGHVPDHHRKLALTALVAVGSALVLSVAFKYGLLVPLPHQGVVIDLMDSLYYGLR
jgi:hypothetical protein